MRRRGARSDRRRGEKPGAAEKRGGTNAALPPGSARHVRSNASSRCAPAPALRPHGAALFCRKRAPRLRLRLESEKRGARRGKFVVIVHRPCRNSPRPQRVAAQRSRVTPNAPRVGPRLTEAGGRHDGVTTWRTVSSAAPVGRRVNREGRDARAGEPALGEARPGPPINGIKRARAGARRGIANEARAAGRGSDGGGEVGGGEQAAASEPAAPHVLCAAAPR